MSFRMSCHFFLALFFFIQISDAKKLEESQVLILQSRVEHLVEKVISYIQDYYHEIKTDLKCIPDCVTTSLMDTLKKSIDCVEENEKNYNSGRIRQKAHAKNLLKCFTNAKKEMKETIKSIDTTVDYCPENMTEKTYEINVTTSFTKTFHINIKNGLEITKKEIELRKNKKNCFGDNDSTEDDEEDDNENLRASKPFKKNAEIEKSINTTDSGKKKEEKIKPHENDKVSTKKIKIDKEVTVSSDESSTSSTENYSTEEYSDGSTVEEYEETAEKTTETLRHPNKSSENMRMLEPKLSGGHTRGADFSAYDDTNDSSIKGKREHEKLRSQEKPEFRFNEGTPIHSMDSRPL